MAAAATKFTLISDSKFVIIPGPSVPGGCIRPIAKGKEMSVFYGWVTENEPGRDPCQCRAPGCLGYIDFDVTDADAAKVRVVDGRIVTTDRALEQRFVEYAEFLRSIGQDHVTVTIATTPARMKAR